VNMPKARRARAEECVLPPLQHQLDRAEDMLRVLDPDGLIQVRAPRRSRGNLTEGRNTRT
jgi:hypothetical protein